MTALMPNTAPVSEPRREATSATWAHPRGHQSNRRRTRNRTRPEPMLMAAPLSHSVAEFAYHGAAWPPAIQLVNGRNDRTVRATAQRRAGATRSVEFTAAWWAK